MGEGLTAGWWYGFLDEYLQSELDVTRCSYKLLASNIFVAHTDYVRRQMVYGLLQVRIPFSYLPCGWWGSGLTDAGLVVLG